MSRELVDLSPGQLHKLAELIHLQEVEKLQGLGFTSYADQVKYLDDAKAARDSVYHLLESAHNMVTQAEAEKDATKQDIAKNVHDYITKALKISLQRMRSYNSRLTYLSKIKSHSDDLINQLKWLDPATQQKEAQRLALEASTYKESIVKYAEKYEKYMPEQFARWLKENKILFENLVESNMSKFGFAGPFKNLNDIQKLQVYESIIEEAGQGNSVVNFASEALGAVGVATLVFTAGLLVWDIYTADDKLEAAVKDSVSALTTVVDLDIPAVVEAATEAGFAMLEIEASAAITVIGAVVGFGVTALIGVAAGALLDLIFSSGSSKVNITDGLTVCRVGQMPDGVELARLVKHNYPDL